jgi:hypothetical protein
LILLMVENQKIQPKVDSSDMMFISNSMNIC